MVEYVLGGSPTNKESPLSSLEPRLRGLKFDDGDKVSVRSHPNRFPALNGGLIVKYDFNVEKSRTHFI